MIFGKYIRWGKYVVVRSRCWVQQNLDGNEHEVLCWPILALHFLPIANEKINLGSHTHVNLPKVHRCRQRPPQLPLLERLSELVEKKLLLITQKSSAHIRTISLKPLVQRHFKLFGKRDQ